MGGKAKYNTLASSVPSLVKDGVWGPVHTAWNTCDQLILAWQDCHFYSSQVLDLLLQRWGAISSEDAAHWQTSSHLCFSQGKALFSSHTPTGLWVPGQQSKLSVSHNGESVPVSSDSSPNWVLRVEMKPDTTERTLIPQSLEDCSCRI